VLFGDFINGDLASASPGISRSCGSGDCEWVFSSTVVDNTTFAGAVHGEFPVEFVRRIVIILLVVVIRIRG